jgi:hypothetical protein
MSEEVETLPEKPLTRIVTLVCDHIPLFGKIKEQIRFHLGCRRCFLPYGCTVGEAD